MTSHWRLPAILLLSLLFGAPALGELLDDPAALAEVGPRYAAALALAWAGVSGIARMVDRFDHRNRLAAHHERVAAQAEEEAARRAALLAERQAERAAGPVA